MKYLVTGGCGFMGSNLSAEVLSRGEELIVIDNLYRQGTEKNLEWLETCGDFYFNRTDIRDNIAVENIIKDAKPDVIFHLAGQVAMTTSLENPRLDFEVNVLGTLNVLEAVRQYTPKSIIIYSSTNKVYGDLECLTYEEGETRYICKEFPEGFDEKLPLDFHSPYGCSKGAADQYMLDYSRMFELRTVVFRHSSMYGGHQFATYDQGWIGWFCQKAIETKQSVLEKPFTISGNGKQVRDVLHADDVVKLYFKTIDNIDNAIGQAFNIGGEIKNSLSLLELFEYLEKELDVQLNYVKLPSRKSDQKIFVANIQKARKLLNWAPRIPVQEGIKRMLSWLYSDS